LNPSLPSPSCYAVSSSLLSKEEGRKRQRRARETSGEGRGRGREGQRCAELRWKLDRASYYPLIATALNKSERANERGSDSEKETERQRDREIDRQRERESEEERARERERDEG